MAGISINLAGNFGKLDELKDKAHKTATSIKAAFTSNIGKAAFSGLAAGATAAFAGIVAAVTKAVDAAGNLNDMMAKTGAAGSGLLVLQRAFENAGLAAGDVGSALNRMQKALAGVNEDGEPTNQAFAKLGLAIADLKGLDPAEAFMKIGASIASIQDPAQRTAVAIELFGKAGGNLNAVFTDSGAFEQAKTQLGGLADLLPQIAGDADTLGDAFGSIDTKVLQLGAGALKELLPQLLILATTINQMDFTTAGEGIGIFAVKVGGLAEKMALLAKYNPVYMAAAKIGEAFIGTELTPEDRDKAKKMADDWAKNDPKQGKETGAAPVTSQSFTDHPSYVAPAAAAVDKKAAAAAEAAKKKAEADAKSAAEKARARAAAVDEYNLESELIDARLAGDAKHVAALEREKKIREEMKRLESAGFSSAESRKPAERKVDADKKATDKEEARKKAHEERKKVRDVLEGKIEGVQRKIGDQQFQSTIGHVSSMQRVGGGGGAVASGLDYARQTADLQREANALMRQLIEVNRKDQEA